MNFLIDNKLVRNIGVSAFDIGQMKEAQKHSKHPIVANQLKFSLWKKSDIKTINYCRENNVMVIAYKVLGRGKLATDKIPFIVDLSRKYNKTEAQIIFSWVISKKNIVALFKSVSAKHLKENKDIFDFQLSREEIKKIDDLVPTL